MLYTLIGNGNPNRKEVVATLSSLKEAVELRESGEDFWMIFTDPGEELSEAHSDIIQWATKNNVSFEYITSSEDNLPEWVDAADYRHLVKNPLRFSVKVTEARPAEGEQRAILALYEDVDGDPELLWVLERANSMGIPVHHLGGQMVQLEIEDEIEEPHQLSTPEPIHRDEELIPSREDLESLTLVELKSLVDEYSVVPQDMRSKESIISALLGTTNPVQSHTEVIPETVEEPEDEDVRYYLTTIYPDGSAVMIPVTQDQATSIL
jgi:hypothetical protein